MKKLFILVSLSTLGTVAALRAQTGGELNRQMEVTRAYEPTVNEAPKLDIKPNMVDTVALRPEFDYSITPLPISYGFQVSPFRAAMVDVNDYRLYTPFYVKAALGVPFQSLLDFYYNTTGMKKGFVSAYLNHYGSWSKIQNDNGVKPPSTQTFNKVGALGERRFGRYSLNGEIGYDYDLVSRYGYYTGGAPLEESFDTTASGLRQTFSTIRGRVSFGDSFEDLSHFNFRVGAQAAYFKDHYDYDQTDLALNLDLGKCFGDRHEVTLKAWFDAHGGQKKMEGWKQKQTLTNGMVTVAPLYHLKTGKFDFALGGDYTYNYMFLPVTFDESSTTRRRNYFFPRFQLRLDVTSGYFVPYIEIDGKLRSNDYRSLMNGNPYISSEAPFGDGGMAVAPNTVEYNGRIGFTGSFSSSFSYKVYGGASIYKDYITPVNYYGQYDVSLPVSYGEQMWVQSDSLTMWTVGADLEGRISGAFGVEASVQYRGFSGGSYEYVSGMPNFTARLNLRYSYRDKLILNLGGTFLSARHFFQQAVGFYVNPTLPGEPDNNNNQFGYHWYERVKPTVDLSLSAEYRISPLIGVFVQGNNLINQKLYRFYHYPGLGINMLAGVKLSF